MARRALVVEDDPDIVELLDHYLSADGWTVDAEADGRRALGTPARAPPARDPDLQLPGMDGLTPRRAAAGRADRDLPVDADRAATRPTASGLRWAPTTTW
jgi:CheY-like chemotaxis protein